MSDPDELRRHLDRTIRAATHLRAHLADLHTIAWEPANHRDPLEERVSGEHLEHDRAPRAGDPRARRLLERLDHTETVGDWLTGCAAALDRLLGADRPIYAPSARGTLVSRPDLQAAREAQNRRRERGEYTPTRLVDQP